MTASATAAARYPSGRVRQASASSSAETENREAARPGGAAISRPRRHATATTSSVNNLVSRPPVAQTANDLLAASMAGGRMVHTPSRPASRPHLQTTHSSAADEASPAPQEHGAGSRPTAMAPAVSRVQRKLVYPSTGSPALNTRPCTAVRLDA